MTTKTISTTFKAVKTITSDFFAPEEVYRKAQARQRSISNNSDFKKSKDKGYLTLEDITTKPHQVSIEDILANEALFEKLEKEVDKELLNIKEHNSQVSDAPYPTLKEIKMAEKLEDEMCRLSDAVYDLIEATHENCDAVESYLDSLDARS